MEHIRQYDWCTLEPDTPNFVTEEGLDNCVTEKILRNKFTNPLISSDSEEEGNAPKIDWDLVFRKRDTERNCTRIFVAGLRAPPAYSRLSALSAQQHLLGLKLLCAQSPRILEDEFIARPTKLDLQAFENMKEAYEKEQKEYIDWAKSMWTNGQCIRALRPKPQVEAVYEAEFKVRANQMKSFPKVFEVVAQIPMEPLGEYEMIMEKELIKVNVSDLLRVQCPQTIRSRLTVLRPAATPEPCEQHPVRFILPNEKSVSVLPLTEVCRSLAEYAEEHNAQVVASEGALRCLAQRRAWALPVAVFRSTQPGSDAECGNVIVLGSEFMNKQETVMRRTFRALRHLLEAALVPASELNKKCSAAEEEAAPGGSEQEPLWPDDASDEGDQLFIDYDEVSQQATEDTEMDGLSQRSEDARTETAMDTNVTLQKEKENKKDDSNKSITEGFGVYNCTCQDSVFEKPPPRSFTKWRFTKKSTSESFDVIVHSTHKFKGSSGEVLVEPIPEYQADMGACKQSEDRIASLSVSLALRDSKTSVLNVRLDATSGDIITTEEYSREQWYARRGELAGAGAGAGAGELTGAGDIAGVAHALLSQLQGLMPGYYILQHETHHGNNALLYAPRNTGKEQQLKLEFDWTQPADADEAKNVKVPPELTPVLLPWHKFRKILPCAFSHYQNQVARPRPARPAPQSSHKTPPRALQWPKKRAARKKE